MNKENPFWVPIPEEISQYGKNGIDVVLDARAEKYGKFERVSEISQSFKNILHKHDKKELSPDMKEALEMILHKIARILNGDPTYTDSWVDIVGYAQLIVDRLNGNPR